MAAKSKAISAHIVESTVYHLVLSLSFPRLLSGEWPLLDVQLCRVFVQNHAFSSVCLGFLFVFSSLSPLSCFCKSCSYYLSLFLSLSIYLSLFPSLLPLHLTRDVHAHPDPISPDDIGILARFLINTLATNTYTSVVDK